MCVLRIWIILAVLFCVWSCTLTESALGLVGEHTTNSPTVTSARLNNASEPLSYDLFLDMTDEHLLVYAGAVDITVRYLGNEGNSLWVNGVGLMVNETSLRMTRSDGKNIPADPQAPVVVVSELEQLHLYFNEELEAGSIYTVHLEFTGDVKTDIFKGLYRSGYRVDGSVRYMATTFFAATYARTVFPCYDEPAYKATFSITIRHRLQYRALSNMPITHSIQHGEHVDTSFDKTPLMATYLMAFVVSDLKALSSDEGIFQVYAPENKLDRTTYARTFALRALRALEMYFDRKNQVPKIDLVAIPDFAMGAMENWGMITFREDYLLEDEAGGATALAKQSIAAIITHELAHMWFGNEVTPEWWTFVWLNEGFARYFENYITAQLEPSWHLWEQFVVRNVHSALSLDCHSSNRPMNYYATDPSILNELYDYVVYAKSASVIRMVQNVIGFDIFRQALNDYLRSRSYLTTKPQYLFESIEKFRTVDLPASVEEIFESWANAPGYPVVSVIIDTARHTLTASQRRFWMPNEIDTPPNNELFYVPISYASSVSSLAEFDDTTPTFWLTPASPEATVTIEPGVDWLIVNKQQTGYYRVNYDHQSWQRLIELLHSDQFDAHLPVINRAQLVDDVTNLARAGEVDYGTALSLMQYLESETEYIPWSTAYNALLHLDRMFSGNKEYLRFVSYVRTLLSHVSSVIKAIGPVDHMSYLHRDKTHYLACRFGVPACLEAATNILATGIQNDTLRIPKDMQSAVFCAFNKYPLPLDTNFELELLQKIVLAGDEFEELMNKFTISMGCAQEPAMITFYLQLIELDLPGVSLSTVMRGNIITSMIQGGPQGRNASLQYVLHRYGAISAALDNLRQVEMFDAFGVSINTQAEHHMLLQIVTIYESAMVPSVLTAARSAIGQAEQNLRWLNRYATQIAEWLLQQQSENEPPGDNKATVASEWSLLVVLLFSSSLVVLMY